MGKGSGRRPTLVDEGVAASNWERTFGSKKGLRCDGCGREVPAGLFPPGEHHICGGVWQEISAATTEGGARTSHE